MKFVTLLRKPRRPYKIDNKWAAMSSKTLFFIFEGIIIVFSVTEVSFKFYVNFFLK